MQVILTPLSGMVASVRRFAQTLDMFPPKRGFVLPAQAGIYLDSLQVENTRMDSGLLRNDISQRGLQSGSNVIPRLRAEGRLTRLLGST